MILTRLRPRLLSEFRHYSAEKFTADVGAGLTVGLVALPLAIAFGIASGVKPTVRPAPTSAVNFSAL